MRWRNSIEGYGAVPQILHWITVALVVLAWFLGQFDGIFHKGAARTAILFVHITAGLAVIGILIVRLLWRVVDSPPPIKQTVWVLGSIVLVGSSTMSSMRFLSRLPFQEFSCSSGVATLCRYLV